jgi:hypothetical protein
MEEFRVGEQRSFDELRGSFSYEATDILEHLDKLIALIELLVNSRDISIHSEIVDKTMMMMISYLHFFSTSLKHHLYKYQFPCYKKYSEEHKRFLLRFAVLCNSLINKSDETINKFLEFSEELLIYLIDFRAIYLQFVADHKRNTTT